METELTIGGRHGRGLGKAIALALVLAGAAGAALGADSFRRGGTEFTAVRPLSVPTGKLTPIVVTEFFHHGEISPDGRNVMVFTLRREQPVPMRLLQLGPGDYCRLAFQTVPGHEEYEVYYGGSPPTEPAPPWTSREGLLLETRHYKDCNLNNLDSVRKAFESARPFGADFVENVHHAGNPFSLTPGPFLSRYSGWLHIGNAGTYGFLTSSQDCSFVLIDEKLVVSAPGRHGPARWALRGSREDIKLAPGVHKFDYYHAAAGPAAATSVAWEINPPDPKPQPVAIPVDVLRSRAVSHVPAGGVSMRGVKLVPDFVLKIAGDVPLPDNPTPLVGVLFRDTSPKALSYNSRITWEFGDGQTSDKPNADHVYLHPGTYAVKLSFKRGASKPVEITNRIYVDRPFVTGREKEKQHSLDDYLPVLQTYDPQALDAAGLRQLVLAYEAKALQLEAKAEAEAAAERAKTEDPAAKPAPRRPPARPSTAESKLLAEAQQYLAKAVEAGKAAFLGDSAARGDQDLLRLAQLIAPMARDRLGDSESALQIWKGAAQRIGVGDLKAECETEAAEVAINDLLLAAAAKPLLEAANSHLGNRRSGTAAGNLQRVWGDYYAAAGDGKSARKAYLQAEQLVGAKRSYIERTAWQGARSRSTEEFLRQGQLDRAAAEIHAWQREFPSDKLDGYVTLMFARYWQARQKYAQAVAQAEQLVAANPDSAYVDQVLLEAAKCEILRNKPERALATLHSLVKDYPGSPLVPEARKRILQLESGTPPPKKPVPKGK